MADGKRKAGSTSGPSKKSKTLRPSRAGPPGSGACSRSAKWGSIAGLVMVLIMSGLFFIAYRSIDIPSANSDFTTQTTHVYYSDGKTDLGQFAIQERDPIDLDEMPETLKDAVVAAEDQCFWTNEGIDPKGILRAAFSNATGGVTQGASTITQQYVKVLYLTQERTWKRKVKEAILSLKIQNQYSKDEVLEGYLNTIYFGRGAYGVQAAAQGVLQGRRQGPEPQAERRARGRPQQPQQSRPRQRQGGQARAQGPLPVRHQRDGRHGRDRRGPGQPRLQAAARVPRRSRRATRTAARPATC